MVPTSNKVGVAQTAREDASLSSTQVHVGGGAPWRGRGRATYGTRFRLVREGFLDAGPVVIARGRSRMFGELSGEKDRFFSRLATIPGIHPMPSVGDWILLQVEEPSDLARRVNRRLAPGIMSVPRGIDGTVRVHVGDPKDNEILFETIRDLCV